MTKRALIIGIEHYLDADLPTVKHAEADATAFAEVIRGHGFDPAYQHVLLNAEATKTQADYRIDQCLRNVADDDTLFVYLVGHGLSDDGGGYLLCHDSVPSQPDATGLSLQTLLAKLQATPCQRIAIFIDCSHDTTEPGLVEDELGAFAEASPSHALFAACATGETSHAHDGLRRGLWSYLLTEALAGQAPDACEANTLITASALQDYLSGALRQTWRKLFTGPCPQTPWHQGLDPTFLLGDIGPILATQTASAPPMQLEHVSLLHLSSGSVKSLSGFQKYHSVPDHVSNSSESFIHGLAAEELQKEIDDVYRSLRSNMNYKRVDVTVEKAVDGYARILTPDFEYTITVNQDQDEPGKYRLEQCAGHFHSNAVVMDEGFLAVFGSRFDTLIFGALEPIDITHVIDLLESHPPEGLSLGHYDPDCTSCEIHIDGLDADVRVDSRSLQIQFRRTTSPAQMLEAFATILNQLASNIATQVLPHPAQDD